MFFVLKLNSNGIIFLIFGQKVKNWAPFAHKFGNRVWYALFGSSRCRLDGCALFVPFPLCFEVLVFDKIVDEGLAAWERGWLVGPKSEVTDFSGMFPLVNL